MLGEILQGRTDVSDAIKAFDKSFNLRTSSFVENPNNSTSFNIGICYFVLRNLPSAYSAILRAIALNPDNPIVYSLMGGVCLFLFFKLFYLCMCYIYCLLYIFMFSVYTLVSPGFNSSARMYQLNCSKFCLRR
jgi:tetratricopeptide (TPR) repeat protein